MSGVDSDGQVAALRRPMDRWLGDGGMPLLKALGLQFEAYGADDGGWVTGWWTPTALAANPRGVVQGGVHAVIHDAAMNFALNAGLPPSRWTRASLEMKTETYLPARISDRLRIAGRVSHAGHRIAFVEGVLTTEAGQRVSRTTATYVVGDKPPR